MSNTPQKCALQGQEIPEQSPEAAAALLHLALYLASPSSPCRDGDTWWSTEILLGTTRVRQAGDAALLCLRAGTAEMAQGSVFQLLQKGQAEERCSGALSPLCQMFASGCSHPSLLALNSLHPLAVFPRLQIPSCLCITSMVTLRHPLFQLSLALVCFILALEQRSAPSCSTLCATVQSFIIIIIIKRCCSFFFFFFFLIWGERIFIIYHLGLGN